jgi:hypothetical protein
MKKNTSKNFGIVVSWKKKGNNLKFVDAGSNNWNGGELTAWSGSTWKNGEKKVQLKF